MRPTIVAIIAIVLLLMSCSRSIDAPFHANGTTARASVICGNLTPPPMMQYRDDALLITVLLPAAHCDEADYTISSPGVPGELMLDIASSADSTCFNQSCKPLTAKRIVLQDPPAFSSITVRYDGQLLGVLEAAALPCSEEHSCLEGYSCIIRNRNSFGTCIREQEGWNQTQYEAAAEQYRQRQVAGPVS